tara:strand:- start:5567 stop:5794 length:228 start_codon:yes stop_codon:yes gene_type:complete
MSFNCPLCREEWIIVNKLCPECEKIRSIIKCYSREKVIEVLQTIFLIQKFKDTDDKEGYKKIEGKWIKNEEGEED